MDVSLQPVISASTSDFIAKLGSLLTIYVSLKTLVGDGIFSTSTENEWHKLVRTEVQRLNDLDVHNDLAYEIYNDQYGKCKKCGMDLVIESQPKLVVRNHTHTFLGFITTSKTYQWECNRCCENEIWNDKIKDLLEREDILAVTSSI